MQGVNLIKTARLFISVVLIGTAMTTWMCAVAFSDEGAPKKRAKVIDFEDEVVEGMNKRPLDSLQQISDGDRRKRKPHLYRTRAGFRSETEETLRLIRFTP